MRLRRRRVERQPQRQRRLASPVISVGNLSMGGTGKTPVVAAIAQYLIDTAHACRLLGCDVVLVGIGVEIAQTLVQLGVNLTDLITLADLQAGVAWAFARQKLRVVDINDLPSARSSAKPHTNGHLLSTNGKLPKQNR